MPAEQRSCNPSSTRSFLSDEVIAKSKHGFGLPFGVWMATHARLKDMAYTLLDGVAERGIANPDFVTDLKDTLLPEHPRYYGPLVWNLIILEAWLHEHETQLQF